MLKNYLKKKGKNKNRNEVAALDWKQFRHMDFKSATPFKLPLDKSDDYLDVEEVVRYIPNNRLVVFGRWRDKLVVTKLFFSSDRKRHLKREVDGLQALISTATPTPNLLWEGTALKNKITVMVTELIPDAVNLDVLWQSKKKLHEDDFKRLMKAITIELATQHVVGIVQEDLHMKNFLVDEKKIYTLDGGSVVQHDVILPKDKSIEHFALFLSQLGANSHQLQFNFLQIYAKARGWMPKQSDLAALQKAIKEWDEKRYERYNKKIQRSSTALALKHTSAAK